MDIEDRVRNYACDALADCAPDRITEVTRFTSGERHLVYKVSYTVPDQDTNHVVVRIAQTEQTRDAVGAEREAAVLRKVQGHAGPLLHDFTPESEWFDVPTTCTQFVPGEQRDLASASPHDIERLGSIVGWVHDLPTEDIVPFFPETAAPTAYLNSRMDLVYARVASYVRDPLPRGVQRQIGSALISTKSMLASAGAAESNGSADSYVLQHGDISSGNVIWNDGPVLIDWEYARLADPADEIAYVFTQNDLAAEQRDAFWRGYRDVVRRTERVDRIADRETWWEPVTLLGSALWWIEQWSRSLAADGRQGGEPFKTPAYHLQHAISRLDRWNAPVRGRAGALGRR